MPIPDWLVARGLEENASFGSIAFFEVAPDGRFAPVPTEGESTLIGQTTIRRYRKPHDVTVQGVCGLDEADDLDDAEGDTATLSWHRGSTGSVKLMRAETKHITHLGIAEVTLVVRINA